MRTREQIRASLDDAKASELRVAMREQIKVELLLDMRDLLEDAVAVRPLERRLAS